jgi:signal transduction histidine kinase
MKQRVGVLLSDAGADERFNRGESIARHQIREVICVPMKGRHDTVGVLFLDTKAPATSQNPANPVKFTDDHLRLAVAVAHQAALAIEETRYYQALIQSERLAAVGQTIAALSHHIKNIMQGVRFGSDMVRAGFADHNEELLGRGWRLVEKNQNKIDDLILDMLGFSKDREPLKDITDLNSLVNDVLDVVRGRADTGKIRLEFEAGPSIVASCDPEGIHRALLNVVSNALDAVESSENPQVLIRIQKLDDNVEIIIEDNGPGIPPDKREEIFKPFVSTKGARGTGLGLPVTRKTLREHGGDAVIESTASGGTRFVLRFPVK